MKDFIKANFPNTPLFNFALEVEKITTAKVILQTNWREIPKYLLSIKLLRYFVIGTHAWKLMRY